MRVPGFTQIDKYLQSYPQNRINVLRYSNTELNVPTRISVREMMVVRERDELNLLIPFWDESSSLYTFYRSQSHAIT